MNTFDVDWVDIWICLVQYGMENKYTYEHHTKFPNVNVSLTKQNKTKTLKNVVKSSTF